MEINYPEPTINSACPICQRLYHGGTHCLTCRAYLNEGAPHAADCSEPALAAEWAAQPRCFTHLTSACPPDCPDTWEP